MQLLRDVYVRCAACHGRRFTRETLAVRYRDHDISQVLDLTIEEALALFKDVPVRNPLLSWDNKYANIGKRIEGGLESFVIPSDPSHQALACLECIQQTLSFYW